MADTEKRPPSDGSDEWKKVQEFFKENPALVPCLALLISLLSSGAGIISAQGSASSARASEMQLRLASRPFLYGRCTPTTNDQLRLSPIPNAVWFAIRPHEELSMGDAGQPK
jgi:hypothetical protein